MTIIINNGFLELTDGTDTLLLYFEELKVDFAMDPTIENIEGTTNYGFDLSIAYLVFKVKGIIILTHADLTNCIDYLKDWQQSAPFTLKIRRNTTPNYIEWDGDNTSFLVLMKTGMREMEKLSRGSIDGPYRIGMIIFSQAG